MRLLSWHQRAVEAIEAVHRALPPDIGFEARRKAIRDAYPFGSREHHLYKAWLRAQRAYSPAIPTSRPGRWMSGPSNPRAPTPICPIGESERRCHQTSADRAPSLAAMPTLKEISFPPHGSRQPLRLTSPLLPAPPQGGLLLLLSARPAGTSRLEQMPYPSQTRRQQR